MTTAISHCIKCYAALGESNWPDAAKDNWIYKCGDCIRQEKRIWARNWRLGHQSEAREISRRCKRKLRISDPVLARARDAYNDCRKRALANNMAFDLTPSFVVSMFRTQTICPYFGTALTYVTGNKENTLASIDRIDSARGYTRDNVQIVSYLANLMKSHASPDELMEFARGVLRMYEKGAASSGKPLKTKG